jgi:hypothetical protein
MMYGQRWRDESESPEYAQRSNGDALEYLRGSNAIDFELRRICFAI